MSRPVLAALWVALVASSCVEADSSNPVLVVTIDQDTVTAGQAVAWSARLVDGKTQSDAVTVVLESDIEPALAHSGRDLFPRVAGTHALTARASVDGEYLETQLELDVTAAAAEHLEFALNESVIVAGESTAFTATAVDAFGNTVDVGALQLAADPAVTLGDGMLSATSAGSFSITAQLNEQAITVPLEVLAGPPTHIELGAEVFTDTVTTTIQLTDAFDNPVQAPTQLQVDGVEHAILGPVVYFLSEGQARLTAVEPSSGLTSDPVTVAVDWSAPDLTIDTPARGDWLTVGSVDFTGTAFDAVSEPVTVEVDGTAVSLSEGIWSHPITLNFGMTVVETLAYDTAGYIARDLRAVVAGDILPLGETELDGMIIRLDEDPAGLGRIERMAEADIEGLDLAESQTNPVFSGADEVCRSQFGYTICVWTELDVDLDSIVYDSVSLQLDGQSSGQLDGQAILANVVVDWSASGISADTPFAYSGSGTASAMLVDFELSFAVIDEAVEVTASNVVVELVDFDLGATSEVELAAAALGGDLDAVIGEVVEDAAAAVLPAMVEDAVEATFADLNVTLGWSQGSGLLARPSEVKVEESGMELRFSTVTTLDVWTLEGPQHGALVRPTNAPTWTHAEPAAMALSLNTLNQIFHANWGGGFVKLEGDAEAFDIDTAIFSAALPGIRSLVGTLQATYPPLFVPDATGQLRMEMPELRVDFYDGEIIEGTAVYTIYVTLSTPVDIALSDNRLDLVWGEQEVWTDIEQAPEDADLVFLETICESFSAGLLLNEYELIDALPLPTIGGSQLEGAAVSFFGPDEAYVVVDGGFREE